jgi:hypothetical protein
VSCRADGSFGPEFAYLTLIVWDPTDATTSGLLSLTVKPAVYLADVGCGGLPLPLLTLSNAAEQQQSGRAYRFDCDAEHIMFLGRSKRKQLIITEGAMRIKPVIAEARLCVAARAIWHWIGVVLITFQQLRNAVAKRNRNGEKGTSVLSAARNTRPEMARVAAPEYATGSMSSKSQAEDNDRRTARGVQKANSWRSSRSHRDQTVQNFVVEIPWCT